MSSELAGKVALVTGSSGGIGRAAALSLARAGADLVVTSTREHGADDTARAVTALKRRALSARCDVSDPESIEALIRLVQKGFGRVDILLNNAATIHRAAFVETLDRDFDQVVKVNLSGPFYLIRRLAPAMVERGWGRIVNVSSISGTVGTPKLSAYCASKWGLNGLTKAIAEELVGTGVSICAVLPGSVDTEMLKGSGFAPKMKAEDVAGVICYLCAEAPNAMNGSLVEVLG
jgi:3-oxoacyl-[acyl-carrier protein] reductase